MNKVFCLSTLVLLILSLNSCTKDEDEIGCQPTGYFEAPASGEVRGAAFFVEGGIAKEKEHGGRKYLDIQLWNHNSLDNCTQENLPDSIVSFTVLQTIGENTLSEQFPVSFQSKIEDIPSSNQIIISHCGSILITEITDNSISGKINAYGDFRNYLNGNFSVPICK